MSTHNEAVEDIKKAKDALDNVSNAGPKLLTHTSVSMIKSAVRIVAGLAIAGAGLVSMNPYLQGGGLLLVIAEVLGIVEELV
jgi:hypothetical protein